MGPARGAVVVASVVAVMAAVAKDGVEVASVAAEGREGSTTPR